MEGDNWAFILGKKKPGAFEVCLVLVVQAEKNWSHEDENVLELGWNELSSFSFCGNQNMQVCGEARGNENPKYV